MSAMTPAIKIESPAPFVPLFKPTIGYRLRVAMRALLGHKSGI